MYGSGGQLTTGAHDDILFENVNIGGALYMSGYSTFELDGTLRFVPSGWFEFRESGVWKTLSGQEVVGGSDKQVQVNSNGFIAGFSDFVWDYDNDRLGVNTSSPSVTLDVNGVIRGAKIRIWGNNIIEDATDAEANLQFNVTGYNDGSSQYRNCGWYDGKFNRVMFLKGQTSSLRLGDNQEPSPGVTLDVNGTIDNGSLRLWGNNFLEAGFNGEATLQVNLFGYDEGATQFRNTKFGDGKGSGFVLMKGSTKSTRFGDDSDPNYTVDVEGDFKSGSSSDNTNISISGLIDPVGTRAGLSRAELSVSGGTTGTTISALNTWTKLTGWTSALNNGKLVANVTGNTIDVDNAGMYKVQAVVHYYYDAPSENRAQYEFMIRETSGTPVEYGKTLMRDWHEDGDGGTDEAYGPPVVLSAHIPCTAGDELEVSVKQISGTLGVVLNGGTFTAEKIGGLT